MAVFYQDRILAYVIPGSAFGSAAGRSAFVSDGRERIAAARAGSAVG